MAEPLGPMRQVQIAQIAAEYYLHGKTRIEIAEETGLSRFKVGRLLDEAVETGIVRFQITSPSEVDLELSMRIRERYELDHAVVVAVPADSDITLQEKLGVTTAHLLREILTEEDVLGVTSGRTLNAMARSISSLRCHEVVQLAGLAGPIQQSGLEVMRRISMLEGVRAWPIYSSLIMSDAQAAEGVRRQPDVRQTFQQFRRITVAVCAIGSWVPRNSLMYENRALSEADRRLVLGRGAVAEIAATLVTDAGTIIDDLAERCIAVDEKQLRAVPTRIGAAGGPSKVRAIRAVLTSRLLTGLVTDAETAQQLLAG